MVFDFSSLIFTKRETARGVHVRSFTKNSSTKKERKEKKEKDKMSYRRIYVKFSRSPLGACFWL